MLRLVLAALLVANAVFFAWTQGVFAPSAPGPALADREPQRLAAQVRPEAVTVLPPPAASAALRAARAVAAVCVEAGPVDDDAIAAAEAALVSSLPEGSWSRVTPPPSGPLWLVATGRPNDAGARRAREADLRRAGLAYETVETAAATRAGAALWVLSRHDSRAAAESALAALPAVRGLRVVEQPAAPPRHWLRVAQADSALQSRLAGLDVAGGFRPCAERQASSR